MNNFDIMIAEDHKIVSDGLESLIEQNQLGTITGKAVDGLEIRQLLNSRRADLIIMDVNMPRADGLETARYIRERFSYIKIMILSTHESLDLVNEFYNMGVEGFLPKSSDMQDFISAIKTIKSGERVFPLLQNPNNKSVNTAKYNKLVQATYNLSNRECEIIQHIAKGHTSKQIADTLFLSEYTVETHRKNIGRKTGAKNPAAIMKFAITNGLT